jgi:DNA repair protein RadD
MSFRLRPYQMRCVDLTMAALDRSEVAAPIVAAATGSGKSVIISALADRLIQENPGAGRVLVATHRAELVEQNHAKLPHHLRGTIYSASVGKKDATGQVIFANIQSIQKQWHKMPRFQAVLIDEAHFAAKAYAEFVEKIRSKQSPGARVIGLTATPYNGSGVWLHMLPEHRIFSGVACEVGIGELLKDGYLAPLTPYRAATRLEVEGVKVDARTGDFAQRQLQDAVDVPELVRQCVQEIKVIFSERNSVLVFCAGVDHTRHVAAALGPDARVVLGDTPMAERAQIIKDFRAGRIKYLCACDVLLVGFDAPATDGIACLRPSRSPLVWVQLLGRGMRPHPGKTDCLVADFCANADHFGPVDEIEGRAPRNSSGDAPTRICDGCFNIILACLKRCPHCGMEFAFEARQQNLDPETGLLISGVIKNQDGTRTYPVDRVEYRSAVTRTGTNALVADYYAPNRPTPVASDWYNLFHHKPTVAQKDGHKWLRRLNAAAGIPTNINEALVRARMGALKVPKFVTIQPGSPFPLRFVT